MTSAAPQDAPRRLRAGVIGLGWAGQQHVAAYAEDPTVDLVALSAMEEHLLAGKEGGVLKVEDVQQFVMTAPGPDPKNASSRQQRKCPVPCLRCIMRVDAGLYSLELCVCALGCAAPYFPNPQTAAFCAMLQIENKVDLVAPGGGGS